MLPSQVKTILRTVQSVAESLEKSLRKAIEEVASKIETATSEYKNENSKPKPDPTIHAVLNRPQVEIEQENTRYTQHEQREGRHEGRDRVRLLVEAVALMIGAAVAVANIALWVQTRRATEIAKISAEAAKKSASAAESQAESLQNQTAENIREFRLAQRPWVVVKTIDLGIVSTDGKPTLKVLTIFTNSGKSPAFDIKVIHSGVQTNYGPLNVDKWVRDRKEVNPNKVITSAVLVPDDTSPLPTEDIAITELQSAQIRHKTLWVYDFGEIQYVDSFGTAHKTIYCGLYDAPTNRFDVCAQHDSVDRNY